MQASTELGRAFVGKDFEMDAEGAVEPVKGLVKGGAGVWVT